MTPHSGLRRSIPADRELCLNFICAYAIYIINEVIAYG